MWHSSLEPADISAITRSVGYPMLTGIHQKLKLSVIDFSLTPTGENVVAQYTMGLENGAAVLYFTYDKEGLVKAFTCDNPFGAPQEWQGRTDSARSKNPRYIVNTLASDSRKSGLYVKAKINDLMNSTLAGSLSSLASNIKRDVGKESALPVLSEDEYFYTAAVAVGELGKLDVPPGAWSNIETFHKAYNDRIKRREEYAESLDSVFNGDKWVVAVRRNLAPRSYSYYVGVINAALMSKHVRRGFVSTSELPPMTVPIQLYSHLTKVPSEYQSDLLGALTMFKLYRQRNYPTMTTLDPDRYVPSTSLLFDKNSGAVSWTYGSVTYLMLDR